MGSADLMPRNLNRRVEVIFPVTDQNIIRNVRDEILEIYLIDNFKARRMQSDGSYTRPVLDDQQVRVNTQEHFLARRTG